MCCGDNASDRARRDARRTTSASRRPLNGGEKWFVLRPNGNRTELRDTRAEAASDLVALKGRGTILSTYE